MSGPSKLRAWRAAEDITQAQAGALVGVSQAAWCDWERGHRAPHVRQAVAISRITRGSVPVESWCEDSEQAGVTAEPVADRCLDTDRATGSTEAA